MEQRRYLPHPQNRPYTSSNSSPMYGSPAMHAANPAQPIPQGGRPPAQFSHQGYAIQSHEPHQAPHHGSYQESHQGSHHAPPHGTHQNHQHGNHHPHHIQHQPMGAQVPLSHPQQLHHPAQGRSSPAPSHSSIGSNSSLSQSNNAMSAGNNINRPQSRPRPPHIETTGGNSLVSGGAQNYSPRTPTNQQHLPSGPRTTPLPYPSSHNYPQQPMRTLHANPSMNSLNSSKAGQVSGTISPGSESNVPYFPRSPHRTQVAAKYEQTAYPVDSPPRETFGHQSSPSNPAATQQRSSPTSQRVQMPTQVKDQIQSQVRNQRLTQTSSIDKQLPSSPASSSTPPGSSQIGPSPVGHRREDSTGSFGNFGESRPTPRRQYMPDESTPGSPTGSSIRSAEGSVTVQSFEQIRRKASQQPHNPQVQFALAKQLIAAASQLANCYSDSTTPTTLLVDSRVEDKNREIWINEAHRITRRLATKVNFPDALFLLAASYSSGGLGLDIDNIKAFEFYMKAAKLDHPEACYRVAVCHELGVGTKRDNDKAMSWYKRAAQLGDVSSMYKLGMISLHGNAGQPQNIGEGLTWLHRAAEKADANTPHAVHELGRLHEKADEILGKKVSTVNDSGQTTSIEQSDAKALEFYYKAADLGYAPSQYRLGHAFEFGELGLNVNAAKSISCYTQSAKNGDPDSELGLAGWYWTGAEGVIRQSDTEAFLWAEKAANRGHAKAEFALGYFYQIGVGVPANQEYAKSWYLKAHEKKHPKALGRLRELGVPM